MKQPIRYFAIGMLTTSIILLVFILFFDENQEDKVAELSIDDMITRIEAENYHVLTSTDYIKLTLNNEKENNNDNEDNSKDEKTYQDKKESDAEKNEEKSDAKEKDADKEDPETYTYTLKIEPNVLGPTVSERLEENKIIDNADEFNRYLEVENYAPYLQLGEYELSSDMDYYEIAEIIAR